MQTTFQSKALAHLVHKGLEGTAQLVFGFAKGNLSHLRGHRGSKVLQGRVDCYLCVRISQLRASSESRWG